MEQSATNTNLIYAGTANSGVWKSTDKGMSWINVTKDMMIGSVLSIEISHANENIVYFGAAGSLYQTTNAGTNWAEIGDAAFQAADHSIRDLVSHPTNAQQLFVCSDEGLFRSDDGGATFTHALAASSVAIDAGLGGWPAGCIWPCVDR